MTNIRYLQIEGRSASFYSFVGFLCVLIILAFVSVYYVEHNGHYVTGMNNSIVWGVPHVFAIFLIVAASGALNIASIASVFQKTLYKPLARLSGALSLTLLVGGLMVLLLDLGRPDRLIVALTEYNFKSIFAWNIILYTGFILVVGIYLWMMLERKMNKYSAIVGRIAFIWRIILTTGTGSIFGFLVARQSYDAVIMAPMFIVMSLSFGLAVYLLVFMGSYKFSGRDLGDVIVNRLGNLLGIFAAAVLYFVVVYHVGNLYLAENKAVENFILFDGGIYTNVFWYGQIIIGSLLPIALIYCPRTRSNRTAISLASILIIFGGFAQLYVIIVGGQAFPVDMFVGKDIISGYETVNYSASIYEVMLGIGGMAIAIIAVVFAVKIFPLLPESLNNKLFEKIG